MDALDLQSYDGDLRTALAKIQVGEEEEWEGGDFGPVCIILITGTS